MAKKTRLLKGTISLIVEGIVQDIPKIDYDTVIQDYLNKRALDELPEALRGESVQKYLKLEYLYGVGLYVRNNQFEPTLADSAFIREQKLLKNQQESKLETIKSSLKAELVNCNNVETFKERFPEFVKYLPKVNEPIVNLPAVQLTEQLHALGWPKSDEGK